LTLSLVDRQSKRTLLENLNKEDTSSMNTLHRKTRGSLASLTSCASIIALGSLALTAQTAHAQTFPYNTTYPYGGGTVSATQSAHNNTISARWLAWKSSFITSNGAGSSQRRVVFDGLPAPVVAGDKSTLSTVSEGQAYGMLFAVYFNDQVLFDDLYAYYKAHLNSVGLMGWKIGYNGAFVPAPDNGDGSATDADEDVATALCFAYKCWGSSSRYNYLAESKNVINLIKLNDVFPYDGSLKRGEWDNGEANGTNVYNASYFMPAWYRVYKSITNDPAWDAVISRGYTLLPASAGVMTGLIANGFVYNVGSNSVTQLVGGTYQADSVRIPWRVGLDWLWYGNTSGKNLVGKIGTFYSGIINTSNLEDPNIGDARNLDGTSAFSGTNGMFVGMAGIAMQVQPSISKSQFALRSLLESTRFSTQCGSDYYGGALHLFSALVLTGNFPNFLSSTVYGDVLASDWLDWSWGSTRDFNNTTVANVGGKSLKVNYTAAYGGLSLRKGTAMSTAGYKTLKFFAYGAGSARPLQVYIETADTGGASNQISVTAPANAWGDFSINLSSLGNPSVIKRIGFQSPSTGTVYFDDIRLAR
jgi:endo-1,4-beta-D-glucanase Y